MSAFIVQDSVIDRIVTFVSLASDSREGVAIHVRHAIEKHLCPTYIDLRDQDTQNALGLAMHALNVAAVNHRYAHNPDGQGDQRAEWNHIDTLPARDPSGSRLRWYSEQLTICACIAKDLRCFLYQCSEGEQFMQSALFVALTAIFDAINQAVVEHLPTYDVAPWGGDEPRKPLPLLADSYGRN
jgi:hypothetical protein